MVVRTDKCVRPTPGNETVNKGFVIQRTDVNPVWVRFDTRTRESFTHAGDARIDTRSRARKGDKMEPAATELQQMFGKDVAKRVIRKKI